MAAAIEAFSLTKAFHRGWPGPLARIRPALEVVAVHDVSLSVNRGELFGLVGQNGAGKSTLIRMLSTLVLPTSGRAAVLGHDVERDGDGARRVIGVVGSDERSFYWRLTTRQNLHFYATLQGLRGRAARTRVEEVVELLDLRNKADERFSHLSTGQKQKAALARALLHRPQVLFLDEPTRSLDPIAAASLRRLIRDDLVNGQGMTVLLTTHNLTEVEELCDRIAIMHQGQVRCVGPLRELWREDGEASLATLFAEVVQGVAR